MKPEFNHDIDEYEDDRPGVSGALTLPILTGLFYLVSMAILWTARTLLPSVFFWMHGWLTFLWLPLIIGTMLAMIIIHLRTRPRKTK